MAETSAYARAFNEGCDARLSGRSLKCNPHLLADGRDLWQAWRNGWNDVHAHWGQHAGWRHAVRPLPRVRRFNL